MDQESLNEQEPEVIRQQIEQTRSSLSHKLESLEEEVNVTVNDAKHSVQDVVENVKRKFDLRYQTGQHPVPMFGAAVLCGYVLGALAARRADASSPSTKSHGQTSFQGKGFTPARGAAAPSSGPPATQPEKSGMLSKLWGHFDDELAQAKKMAIGAVLGAVRDLTRDKIPSSLAPQMERLIDGATRKLGGSPVSGRVIN